MKKKLVYTFLVFICVLLIINPQASINCAAEGLSLCGEIIVPSLFPFFICSGLLIYSGFCENLSKIMQPVMKPLFNVNGSGAAAFVLGLISGYPLGAVTVCNLYENFYLSKNEAERMLAFCNNSGPLFILGAVGAALYQNPKIGIILYVSHIFAAIAVGIIFGFYKRNSFCAPYSAVKTKETDGTEIFSSVLANSIQSILTVCGAIVFFSVVSNLIIDLIPVSDQIKACIIGLFEFSSGVNSVAASSMPLLKKLVISSAVVGFAGLCVHIQVLSVTAKHALSLKPYILGKLLQSVISALFTLLLLRFVPIEKSVFSPVNANAGGAFAMNSLFVIIAAVSIFFISLSAIIFGIFENKHRNKVSNTP